MSSLNLDAWIAERSGLLTGLFPASLADYQLGRLRELLAYTRQHSPWYGERYQGFPTDFPRAWADIASLPLMSAADIVEQGLGLLCQPPSQVRRIVSQATSGSLGLAKRLYFSEADLALTVDFFANGMATMAEPGQKIAICLPGENPDGLADLLSQALRSIGTAPCVVGLLKDEEAAAQLCRLRPAGLIGMPRQMLRIARLIPELRPDFVLLSAENVTDETRQGIAGLWHCPVRAHWGMTETGYGGAVECGAAGEHHIRHADLLVEIVGPAGQPLPAGEWGEIVITTLNREAMSLIRYRTGDYSCLRTGPCACGSQLPRLGRIAGHDKPAGAGL